MTQILLKRGLKQNLANAGVVAGELKFTTDEKKVYIGTGTENKKLLDAEDDFLEGENVTFTLDEETGKRMINALGGGGGGLGAPDFDNAIALPRSPFPLVLTAPEDGYLFVHSTENGRIVLNIGRSDTAWSDYSVAVLSNNSYDCATMGVIDKGRIFRVLREGSCSIVSLTFVPIKK